MGCCSSYNLCFCYLFPTPSVAVQLFFLFLYFFILGYQRKTYCILGRKFYCICFKRKAFFFFFFIIAFSTARAPAGWTVSSRWILSWAGLVRRSVGRFCFESHGWMDFIEMGYLSWLRIGDGWPLHSSCFLTSKWIFVFLKSATRDTITFCFLFFRFLRF